MIGDTRYHYGYAIDGESIVSEWLYSFSLSSSRQTKTVLFHRSKKEDKQFYFGKTLKGDNKRIANLVRPNSLFLSAAAQNSHPHLQPIYDFFCDKITRRIDETSNILLGSVSEQLTAYFKDDDVRRKKALSFVRAADIGIADFDFSKQPIGEKQKNILHDFELLLAKHIQDPDLSKVFDGKDEKVKVELLHLGESDKNFPIPLKDESSGTLSLLQLLGPIFSRLSDGGVLIVDELNITLHPLVSRELIKLFSSPKTNPGKAQLVFTTHDTSMLVSGLLRRDQIWFAEKDRFGATSIYSLSSIKVRSSDNLEKGYITGRFGAVPLFGIRSSDFKRIGIASDLDEGAI
ncbi:MAG: hypothetical protein A2061_07440 [Gallionellales bacterium GWA2_59_43]|nr:MAG: hypothetical protein A2061_07440 [Gallionellales bacterium GWA2_59_43]